jgi:hypothetical protein
MLTSVAAEQLFLSLLIGAGQLWRLQQACVLLRAQAPQHWRHSSDHPSSRLHMMLWMCWCCAGNVEWGDKALQVAEAVLARPENSNLALYLFR